MAKISSSALQGILAPAFKTGGAGNTDPGTNKPGPGVVDYTPSITRADPRDALNVSKSTRKRVMVLSPFMMEDLAQASKMTRYAKRCAMDSLNRNEACIMFNLFYSTITNYTSPVERDMALHSAMTWISGTELLVIYVDFGITPAMQVVINVAETKNKKIEYRSIGATA